MRFKQKSIRSQAIHTAQYKIWFDTFTRIIDF